MNDNVITLVGEATKEFSYVWSSYGEKFYEFEIKVKRQSGAYDYLDVVCSDRTINVNKSVIGKMMYVFGDIRTFNEKIDGKAHVKVYAYADELYSLDESIDIVGDNVCDLKGFICKKSEVRATPLGRKICDVILAVHRDYCKSDYIPCVFWGKNADAINELEVGTKISMSGRFQSRDYIKNEELHTIHEVSAQVFEVVE